MRVVRPLILLALHGAWRLLTLRAQDAQNRHRDLGHGNGVLRRESRCEGDPR